MTTQFVNKRAIDTEELFQIINNSDGIYESTLLKILQCNRISLESRLKTLEKNKMITKQKLGKYFFYTNHFDSKNLSLLDSQANIIQKLVDYAMFTETIQIITKDNNYKEIYLSAYSSGKLNFKTNEQLKKIANVRYNQLTSVEERDWYLEFLKNELTKCPIRLSSITNKLGFHYHTDSLDTVEILSIPNIEYIPILEAKLDDFSYKKIAGNTDYIRDDILLYIESENRICYFDKIQNRQYELKRISSIMDFFYVLAKNSKSKDTFYFSSNTNELDTAHQLYNKSQQNKKKFNTVQLKKNKQKAQS
ncbi:hypothetical protein ACIJEB_000241 [Enterococcus faecium]|uniref:hypothetical protein n=1 Tax=Enterococcus faecalis TaxID=1351 RepID=UPI00094ED238|nr:hypothetical protein [Enterococcus faecalis]MUO25241.1 hypothetical protein [Enterococcus faecalis]NSN09578.1 hypothetical protein [Enterococcus faecalis]HBI1737523.1 hypothetical protein [Enterococcus faecalis]HBI1740260.1 hypothetical protein [Enterococcus faecalis]HBI1743119.1 hypothetical protein [Enterococcus faecalis]